MTHPLTYHGVEVPVWETSHAEEMPAGPGWARANVPTEPMDTLPCWRRPHPWRVMLEGVGRSVRTDTGGVLSQIDALVLDLHECGMSLEDVAEAHRRFQWEVEHAAD